MHSTRRPISRLSLLVGAVLLLSRCYEGIRGERPGQWLEVAAVAYLFARLRVEPA